MRTYLAKSFLMKSPNAIFFVFCLLLLFVVSESLEPIPTNEYQLLWGTYKPHLLFSLAERLPNPLVFDFFYSQARKSDAIFIRRWFSPRSFFGTFTHHDGFSSSQEVIKDFEIQKNISIDFAKVFADSKRQGWVTNFRVDDLARKESKWGVSSCFGVFEWLGLCERAKEEDYTSLFFGVSFQDFSTNYSFSSFSSENDENGRRIRHKQVKDNEVLIEIERNNSASLLNITFSGERGECQDARVHIVGSRIPEDTAWDWEFTIRKLLKRSIDPSGFIHLSQNVIEKESPDNNMALVQITTRAPCNVTVSFDSQPAPYSYYHLGRENLYRVLKKRQHEFHDRIKETMAPEHKKLQSFHHGDHGPVGDFLAFTKSVLSNLLGGVAFYHGTIGISKNGQVSFSPEGQSVFTATPSRSNFPRGFMWDEGFHQYIICKYSPDLCLEFLSSWFDLMDESGYIPREQVRNPEISSIVPKDYVIQHYNEGNPPAFLFPIGVLLRNLASSETQKKMAMNEDPLKLYSRTRNEMTLSQGTIRNIQVFLKRNHHRLVLWFQWFSQQHANSFDPNDSIEKEEADVEMFEHDRHLLETWTDCSDFACDLPVDFDPFEEQEAFNFEDERAEIEVNEEKEEISQISEEGEKPKETKTIYKWALMENHRSRMFYMGSGLDDYPRHDYNYRAIAHVDLHCWIILFVRTLIETSRVLSMDPKEFQEQEESLLDSLSLFLDKSRHTYGDLVTPMYKFSPEIFRSVGYVTLFPLMFGLIREDSPEFLSTLEAIRSEEELWTDFGLRSLSRRDKYYMKNDQYWTGPIWIHMNFLVLRGLRLFYPRNLAAKELYSSLRANVMRNIFRVWEETGYIFENYNDLDGSGQKGHPFYGWTSTIVLIINEAY